MKFDHNSIPWGEQNLFKPETTPTETEVIEEHDNVDVDMPYEEQSDNDVEVTSQDIIDDPEDLNGGDKEDANE